MLKKILPALLIVTCLLSCSSPDTLAPTAAVDGMINAMKSGDFEKTKKFISRNDVAMLEAGERFMSSIDPDGIKKMKEKMAADFSMKRSTAIRPLLKQR